MTSYTITANDVPMGSYKGATRDRRSSHTCATPATRASADAAEALAQTEVPRRHRRH